MRIRCMLKAFLVSFILASSNLALMIVGLLNTNFQRYLQQIDTYGRAQYGWLSTETFFFLYPTALILFLFLTIPLSIRSEGIFVALAQEKNVPIQTLWRNLYRGFFPTLKTLSVKFAYTFFWGFVLFLPIIFFKDFLAIFYIPIYLYFLLERTTRYTCVEYLCFLAKGYPDTSLITLSIQRMNGNRLLYIFTTLKFKWIPLFVLVLFEYLVYQNQVLVLKDLFVLLFINYIFQVIVGGLYGVEKGRMMLCFVHDEWEIENR